MRGGGISWQHIGLSHNELDFLKGREAHRNEILNLFGIPVGLVSENATEANARVAERLFIERTLWPRLVRIAGKITQDLLPFWPGEHVAQFEDIRPTDVRARLEEIRTALPLLAINELRERYYQLGPVPWGKMPAGMAAAEAGAAQEPGAESGGAAAIQELRRWERFTLRRREREGGAKPGEASRFRRCRRKWRLRWRRSCRACGPALRRAARCSGSSGRRGLRCGRSRRLRQDGSGGARARRSGADFAARASWR